ncbi:MAG TPA: UTP--glucose-1-phosphate uridylyltransferase [Acidobacteriota bacterium]|jgi:UTP--glucose-1-phosphate uridylyltransferase|nr:UTP--glucose-1-phosphate uridylyltransferase [Acidobacteriota bacterium]
MNDQTIQTAVIPVAGFGTRLLPATKSQPKEMLPVAKKPVVQYVVEELEANGIKQILFVTGRNKTSIEDHFDFDYELTRRLREGGKEELLPELEYERMRLEFFYSRQRRQKGLGDAVLCAQHFTGDRPFVVALGDSILGLNASSGIVSTMIRTFEEQKPACVLAVERVPEESVSQYGIVDPENASPIFRVRDLIEKPRRDEAPSNLAIAARYVFSPDIYQAICNTRPGKNQEIQLTDAIRLLLQNGQKVIGVCLPPGERRYDIGNFHSYFEAFIDFALSDPQLGPKLRQHVRKRLDEDS